MVVVPAGTSGWDFALAQTIENHPPSEWDLPAIQVIIQQTADLIFDPQELALNGSFSWVKTQVKTVEQGRRILDLVRKVRDGRSVTTNEVLASLEPEPAAQAEPISQERQFIVTVAQPADPVSTVDFACTAISPALAIEQALQAHPGHELLMHFMI